MRFVKTTTLCDMMSNFNLSKVEHDIDFNDGKWAFSANVALKVYI